MSWLNLSEYLHVAPDMLLVAQSRSQRVEVVCDVDVYGRPLPLVGRLSLAAESRVCDVDVYGRLLPLVGTVNLVADSRVRDVDVYGRLSTPPGWHGKSGC